MFESLNHDFIVAVASCIKRKLGIALFAIICIILLFSNAAHAASAQGQVFEDVNYGGGPGRTQAASSGVGIANVRVELYNSSGFYVTDTTTNASGAYTFSSISSGTYYVRVVNSTVRSSRAGSTGAEVGVQTYRREGTDITNEVGGRHPAQVDVAANTSSQSLNTSTWRLSGGGYVQSVTTVTVPSAGSVSNVNFGFNFSTIVNTNDAGQGSLRQFILNANLLANTGLNQTTFNSISKDAGWNHSIFNIPNVAGLRTADSSTLSGGTGTAYLIRPTTSLPPITRSNVAIDGRTQTAFSGDTNSAVADVSTGPEIIIDHQGSVQNGVLQSNNALVQIWNVGVVNTGDTSSTSGGINIVGASASGSRIENVTAARNADSGINVGVLSPHVTGPAANNVIIRGSIIRNNGRVNAASDGIGIYNSSSGTLIVNNSINNNASYGIDIQSGTVTGTTIQNNRIYSNGATSTANQRAGIGVRVGNTMTIRDNEIFSNSGDGIVVLNGSRFIDITQNEIYRNGELGIDLSANTAAAGDGMTPNGNPPTATGGNDLLNFPQLIYSQVNGTTLYVEGCAPSGARIEIFEADITGGGAALNDNKQPSSLSKDYGEGFAYLGTFTHTSGELCTITSPDADGNAATSMTWFRQVITTPYNLPVGRYVTATAHYDDRGTSEFSGIQQVNAATVHNCPVGTTATGSGFATAGSGLYKDQLYWLDWSCGAVSQYNPGDTINKQWSLPNGATINAVVTDITATIETYNTGYWGGDQLDDLYGGINPIGLKNVTAGGQPTFNIEWSTTVGNQTTPVNLVFADAEDLAQSSGEFLEVTTDGQGWQLLESIGSQNYVTFSNAARTLRLDSEATFGAGTAVAFSRATSNISAEVKGGGKSAIAFAVGLGFDYGDGPASYGTTGSELTFDVSGSGQPTTRTTAASVTKGTASFLSTNWLGSNQPDAEAQGQHTADATGDDVAGIDDEDGVVSFPALAANATSYQLDVVVNNTDTGSATLVGWIDFNGDGVFSASEAATATVPAGTTAGTVQLNWTGLDSLGLVVGDTVARLRISTDSTLDADKATGALSDGEVEDYTLTITQNPKMPTPPPPSAICTAEWYKWSPTGFPNNNRKAYNFVKYGWVETADGWWANYTAPTHIETIPINQLVEERRSDPSTDLLDYSEVHYGIFAYQGVPNAPFSKTLIDSGSVEGYAVRLRDSAGNQLARYPSADHSYYASVNSFFEPEATNESGAQLVGVANNVNLSLAALPADGLVYIDILIIDPSEYMFIPDLMTRSCLEYDDWSDTPNDGSILPSGDSAAYGDANHVIVDGIRLGATNTADAAPDHSANADGDVGDDGITLPTFTQGQATTIAAEVHGTGGYLNAWIDWNGNGVFEAGEQVATDLQDGGGLDTSPTTGTINFTVNVPATATTSPTFARFRWSSTSGLDTTTAAPDGEVEDYQVTVAPPPSSGVINYPNSGNGLYRGSIGLLDWAGSGLDDGIRNGDSVSFALPECRAGTLTATFSNVTNPANATTYVPSDMNTWSGAPFQNAYNGPGNGEALHGAFGASASFRIDWTMTVNGVARSPDIFFFDAESSDPGPEAVSATTNGGGWALVENIGGAGYTATGIGTQSVTIERSDSPSNTPLLLSMATSRTDIDINAEGGLQAVGFGVLLPCDSGDAGGVTNAAHAFEQRPASGSGLEFTPGQLYLGSAPPDAETGGQGNGDATGDDADALGDDEDGVTLPTLTQGASATLPVNVTQASANQGYLQGWIDWNGDGDFADAGEQVATDLQSATAGTSTINVPVSVPATATTSPTFARFRWSSTSGLDTTNAAPDGEVEDYQVTILQAGYTVAGRVFEDHNANGVDDGESGLGKVGVVLHDTVTNTCQTTRSAANGSYQFTGVENGGYVVYEAATAALPAPATCPPAANDPTGYVSTTANQQAVTVAGSNVVNVDFGDARAPRFEPDHSGTVLPNSSVVYPHRFVTYADGQVAVNIIDENADPATLTWSSQLFLDANCDGVLNSTDSPLTTARTLSAGNALCLLVKVLSPANLSSGATHTLTLQSEWMYGNGLLANQPANDLQTRQDITTGLAGTAPTPAEPVNGEGKLSLVKSVWNVTRGISGEVALPGETLRYTVQYENVGNGPLHDFVINDSVTAFTTLSGAPQCGSTPTELGTCTPSVNSTALDWTFSGHLPAGASGEVFFEVAVD